MGERRPYGELKHQILQMLGSTDVPLSARSIIDRWPGEGPAPVLTTVLTVLDRLRRAGVVERTVEGQERRFALVPETAAASAESMLRALLASADRGGALMTFAGSLEADDLRVLRRAVGAADGAAPEEQPTA